MNLPLPQHGEWPGRVRSDPRGGSDRCARAPGVLRIAFGIVSLFPGGGLQRNCLAIARILRRRGHEVVIFTSRAAGPLPGEVPIEVLDNSAWTNHGRNRRFAADLADATSDRFDLVVGFDKLSGLDLIYCADASVAARRGWRRLTPRYRALRALEAACFAAGAQNPTLPPGPPPSRGGRPARGARTPRAAPLPPPP